MKLSLPDVFFCISLANVLSHNVSSHLKSLSPDCAAGLYHIQPSGHARPQPGDED